ncbi:MAG: NAD(P)/FAD-dependent oxidoreductase [Anaerolineales bacterium]|nr:MAG: NAD(P)/FAD-dependent oxidoreductase [Anaerolineales bacterium]
MDKNARYDVIVIGAGPAGMMAAGQAAQAGAKTLLLEKMEQPGRKLQLTGKGRCNLTNTAVIEEFIPHFGRNGRFLRSSFSKFFNQDLLDFLHKLNVQTQVERGGRVFPVSQDAIEIVQALIHWNKRAGVSLRTSTRVESFLVENHAIQGLRVTTQASEQAHGSAGGSSVWRSRSVILATGGASYPGTGSTGDGYRLAEAVGHSIIPVRPALVPLVSRGKTAANMQGLSLRNVKVSVLIDGRTKAEAFGEMLFTHFGLSGPVILTLSRHAVDGLLAGSTVQISIDLKPALDEGRLDARLLRDLDAHGKKQFHSILKGLLPQKMIPICLNQVGIPADKPAHQVSAEERKRVGTWLKNLRFDVVGHRAFLQAVITAGGVDLRQVDPGSMASKLIQGLYFAGEVLDLDADTGGYNLQAAFSTGWLAGVSAAEHALSSSTE